MEPKLFPDQPDPQKHVDKHKTNESGLQAASKQLNDIATRLKIIEERYGTLKKKMQLTEQNIIQADKENFQERQLLSENLLEVKKVVKELNEKVSLLSDEVGNFVDDREFTTLQRYVDFWQPMDFVTRKEVNDFLRKRFSEEKKKK